MHNGIKQPPHSLLSRQTVKLQPKENFYNRKTDQICFFLLPWFGVTGSYRRRDDA